MNQETLLKANAQLYGTLTIIGGVLDGYVDHEMDNGRQPDANLGVAAGLATKVLNDVEKLFDEAAAPDYTMADLETAAKARFADINTAQQSGLDAFTNIMGGVVNEFHELNSEDAKDALAYMSAKLEANPAQKFDICIHPAQRHSHSWATRQFCKLCTP